MFQKWAGKIHIYIKYTIILLIILSFRYLSKVYWQSGPDFLILACLAFGTLIGFLMSEKTLLPNNSGKFSHGKHSSEKLKSFKILVECLNWLRLSHMYVAAAALLKSHFSVQLRATP